MTTHFRLTSRLRMSGGMPLLPLYDFMAWTRRTFLLLLSNRQAIVFLGHWHSSDSFIDTKFMLRCFNAQCIKHVISQYYLSANTIASAPLIITTSSLA
jgi:hypothetical protein